MADDPHNIGEPEEIAALYLAGGMSSDEKNRFEHHIEEGCPQCAEELARYEAVADNLVQHIEPVKPDPAVRESMMKRLDAGQAPTNEAARDPQVWKSWPDDAARLDLFVRRADECAWENTGIEGVDVRRLFNDADGNRMTALVRMAPGTSYPAHVHNGPEECFVIQGDLRSGDHVLNAGDYERRPAGSNHGIQSTEDGCLLLIVSSLCDELSN